MPGKIAVVRVVERPAGVEGTRGADGRYWVGLVKPRSAFIDATATRPWVRAMAVRLPRAWWPVPPAYGHVFAFDATAFEIDTAWLIEAAARRQKWIDQAQSLNIYMAGASGKKLDDTYKLAWLRGLKTTYYLRTLGATSAEKSTGRAGQLNAVAATGDETPATDAKFCSIDNPECEACQ